MAVCWSAQGVRAEYRCHGPAMPFSVCSPRSSNSIRDPVTRPVTVLETRTSPGWAIASTRDPMCTAMPTRVPPLSSHSPAGPQQLQPRQLQHFSAPRRTLGASLTVSGITFAALRPKPNVPSDPTTTKQTGSAAPSPWFTVLFPATHGWLRQQAAMPQAGKTSLTGNLFTRRPTR